MSLRSILTALRSAPPLTLARAAGRRAGFRPQLEPLEDRCLLSADVVLRWNELLLGSLASQPPRVPMARNMALVHVAMFDAVNAIDRSYEPYYVKVHASSGASQEAAVAQAAYDTLTALYPSREAIFKAALDADLAGIDSVRARQGIAIGQNVAQQILELRSNDGSSAIVTYTPPNDDPGQWHPTDNNPVANAHVPFITPFAIESNSQFSPRPHPALGSPEYAHDFNEVKELGRATGSTRTPEQTQIGLNWQLARTNHQVWNRIAQNVAAAAPDTTIVGNARLFALLNMALNDGLQTSNASKFYYGLWRPVEAIPHGGLGGANDAAEDPRADGNPDTVGEEGWRPLHGTTPAYPAYASNASTIGAACATVLGNVFGSDAVSFDVPWANYHATGVTRSYVGFWAAADEMARSRVYGGIHYTFDCVAGQEIGMDVGGYVLGNFLQPRHEGGAASGLDALPQAASPAAILSSQEGPSVTSPSALVSLQEPPPAHGAPAQAGQGLGGGISRSATGTASAGGNALDALFGNLASTGDAGIFDLFG